MVWDQLGLTSICRQWWGREGNTQHKSLFLGFCDMVWSVGEKGRGPVRMVGAALGTPEVTEPAGTETRGKERRRRL